MKMLINEIAALTGVSVRTLHYYDKIGLLKPSYVDEHNGYRFYDEKALERMQQILFFRELDFSLKAISEILSSPSYDKTKTLKEQRRLLVLKKERLERIIQAIDSAEKGEIAMSFSAFDDSELEAARKKYAEEAKEKWGDTAEYRESVRRTSDYSKEKWAEINSGTENLIREFAECMNSGKKPGDSTVQDIVGRWKEFIGCNFYSCTNEILLSLGEMYSRDERFTENIDRFGKGTAPFITEAIRKYCE